MAFKFERGNIPINEEKTFGVLMFVSVEKARPILIDGAETGEIAPRRVTLLSDAQGSQFEVTVPNTVNLDGFTYFDEVKLVNSEVKAWAIAQQGSNFAETDFKVTADDLVKSTGGAKQPVSNGQQANNVPLKDEQKTVK